MTVYRSLIAASAALACCCASAAELGGDAPSSLTTAQRTGDAIGEVPPAATVPAISGSASASGTQSPQASEGRVIRGTGQVIAPAKLVPALEGVAGSFKFEDAPIADVVRVIVGDVMKVDYVLHQPIAGSVTLSTRGDVSVDQAVALLESALQANGLMMARDTRGVYHVGRPDALKGIFPAVRQNGPGPLPPGHGAVVVPLQYIGATEMASILRPMLPPEALVRVDAVRNLLILVGTRTQAEGWLDIVNTFDVDLLKGMSIAVFPLKYATVREVEAALRLMTTGSAATPTTAPGASGAATVTTSGAAGAASAAAAVSATNPFLGAVRVMPIERINSILVVTPRAAYLDEARRWIERLDRPGENSAESQLFVYPVQNGSARHLADVLNGVFGDGRQATATTTAGTGVAPGLTAVTSATSPFGAQTSSFTAGGVGANSLATSGTNRSTGTQGGAGVTAVNLGTGVRVVADEVNNAILVYGLRSDYLKIESSLRRLDVPPTQVLIEASIIEVTLNDTLQYGLQWFFTDTQRNGLTGTGTLSLADGGVLGGAKAGFSYTLRNSLGDIRAILNALADKSLVKVISSPSLMVLDNYTAAIAVGTQQPIKSGETVTTGGNVSTSIQYKDTGVSLSVTPSVNAGNIVSMSINQMVTDVGAVDTATGQRSFQQRQIASKVAVRSGEALVLGGLIRDNTSTGKTGIPLLQDIPVVGNLFGTTNKNTARTELLVVITPRVVRSDQDVREISDELRERMKSFGTKDAWERLLPLPVVPGPKTGPNFLQ